MEFMKLNIQMFADGKVVIETEMDTSGVDKSSKEIEKRLEKLQNEYQKLEKQRDNLFKKKSDIDKELNQYYELMDSLVEVNDKFEEIYKKAGDQEGLKRVEESRKIFASRYEAEYGQALPKLYEIENQLDQNKKRQEEIKQEIIKTTQEAQNFKNNLNISKNVEDIKKNINDIGDELDKNVGNSIQKIGKKTLRWIGYIFGIRSAYAGVRKMISIVGKENENIANQMKGLGAVLSNGLAKLFAPLVQNIINLMAKLMMYIDYIYYRLTDKHLFDFSKVFSSAEDSSSGIAKNMKKITAGFDEMNVLEDTSSGAVGGGGSQSFDNPFEGWENFEPPGWLKTIGDVIKGIADIVQKYWKGIVVALIVGGIALMITKFVKFIKGLKDVKSASKGLKGISADFTGFFDSLGKGIEAIAILGGLALVLQSVSDLITTFAESGLTVNEVLGLMATIIGSIVVLITALTVGANALQSPLAMAGLLLLVESIAIQLLVLKETLPTILDAIGKFIVEIGPTLNMILETIGQNIEDIIYALGTVLPPIIEELGNTFDKIFNGIDKIIQTVGKTIVKIMDTAKNSITTVLDKILEFINKLGPAVNRLVDNIIKAVTKVINFIVSGVEYLINTVIIDGLNGIIKIMTGGSLGEAFADWFGFDLPRINHIEIARFVPRLAKGGIVNNPGHGVMMGSYIAGERGPEAVIPLDDDTLDRLGLAFARHTQINATVPVYVGNRQIAREIRKINAEDDFAFNV